MGWPYFDARARPSTLANAPDQNRAAARLWPPKRCRLQLPGQESSGRESAMVCGQRCGGSGSTSSRGCGAS
jgi:hypothetical protein